MDDYIVKRLRSASHAFCSFIYDVLYPVTWCIKIIPFYAYGRILILRHVNYRERYRCGDIICVAHHDLDTTYRSQLSTKWMCCVLLSAKFYTLHYMEQSKSGASIDIFICDLLCCIVRINNNKNRSDIQRWYNVFLYTNTHDVARDPRSSNVLCCCQTLTSQFETQCDSTQSIFRLSK